MTENIVHRKYRILKDALNDIWDRISMWKSSEDITLNSGTNLDTDLANKNVNIDALFSDFAHVETTSTASQSYKRGEMLIYNNTLYRVKTAIAPGNTLTVGTNIEARKVSTISEHLVASDGAQFYFDVKDGKYGYYPNASKTASQFVSIT